MCLYDLPLAVLGIGVVGTCVLLTWMTAWRSTIRCGGR